MKPLLYIATAAALVIYTRRQLDAVAQHVIAELEDEIVPEPPYRPALRRPVVQQNHLRALPSLYDPAEAASVTVERHLVPVPSRS